MRVILKQTSWLFLAQVLSRLIGFFYTLYVARVLGVSDFGLLTVALTYFSLLSAVSDFGFNRFLIREVARDKSQAPYLLCNISLTRLTLTSVLFAVFAVAIYILDADKLRVSLILLAVLAVLPQTLAQTLDGIFVALQRLSVSALALALTSLVTAMMGYFLIASGFGPTGAVSALIFGQLVYLLILGLFLLRTQCVRLVAIKLPTLKSIFIGSLPYGVLGIMGLLYFRIDTLMLSYFRGSFETGLYGVSFRFLEAVVIIPSVLSVALFPVLAKLHDHNLKQLGRLYFRSLKVMGFLGVVTLGGYFLILPWVIENFLPNYISSIPAVRVLALSIPFMFLHMPAVQVLLSTDKFLKSVVGWSLLTLGFNVLANFLFIPSYGLMAAAWITTLSEILSFVVFFLLTKFQVLDRR